MFGYELWLKIKDIIYIKNISEMDSEPIYQTASLIQLHIKLHQSQLVCPSIAICNTVINIYKVKILTILCHRNEEIIFILVTWKYRSQETPIASYKTKSFFKNTK